MHNNIFDVRITRINSGIFRIITDFGFLQEHKKVIQVDVKQKRP